MMVRINYTLDLLKNILVNYGAKSDINDKKLQVNSKIEFTCKCKNVCTKTFRSILKCGALCKVCTEKNRQSKIIETNMKKYGVARPLQNKTIQNKVKQTNLERFGVEYPTQLQECTEKRKKTCLNQYGVENISQNLDIKNKKIETVKYSLGVNNPSQSEIIKDKKKKTTLKNHGVEYPQQAAHIQQKSKETNLSKLGVENPSQSSEIMEKKEKSGKKFKEIIMPSGEKRKVQGFEPFAIQDLLKTYSEHQIKTNRRDVPRITYIVDEKKHYYFPDIYIPDANKIIEVKSIWTYHKTVNRELKKQACLDQGYIYEFWCYSVKGCRIEPN
jgi:hypothetical protein